MVVRLSNLLITGNCGLIGGSLSRLLLSDKKSKYNLTGIDNFSTGIEYNMELPTFNIDLSDFNSTTKVIEKIKPKIIVHLADDNYHNPNTNPQLALKNSFQTLVNTLTSSLNVGSLKRFIFVSTNKYRTSFNSNHYGDLYITFKLCCERFIMDFCTKHNIIYTIIHVGDVYGVGMNYSNVKDNSLINYFKLFKLNKSICVDVNLNNLTEYVYVDDLTKFIYYLINKKDYPIVNYLTKQIYDLNSVLNMMKEITKSKSEIKKTKLFIKRSYLDDEYHSEKYSTKENETKLKDGLIKLYSWLESEKFC
jgi:nucleoside-diphosphate-sugar epimerase